MSSETPKAIRFASISLFTVPLAILMGLVGSKGFQSQDNSRAILSLMGFVLTIGLASGIAALCASRRLELKWLRVKATTGIVLNLAFAGFMAIILYVIS